MSGKIAILSGFCARDPAAVCDLLDIEITLPGGVPEILPNSYPVTTLTADLLLRVGPNRLAHV